ncbi:MAG: hypothetical protein HYW01_10070 [Deltaproteobacteria bacterium]|nr:hypothetical protein [Deltaproteobacteria bacterium]
MIRKLSFVTIILISMLLLSLPLYGQRRRGGKGSNIPLGSLIVELGSAITGSSSGFTPAVESHGILSLKVTTQDAEMYVDGRFIGLARDFKGPAVVSAPSGDHVIEFKYNGLSYKTNAHITRGRTTSLVYTFNTNES